MGRAGSIQAGSVMGIAQVFDVGQAEVHRILHLLGLSILVHEGGVFQGAGRSGVRIRGGHMDIFQRPDSLLGRGTCREEKHGGRETKR
jgi:hypothetical protein